MKANKLKMPFWDKHLSLPTRIPTVLEAKLMGSRKPDLTVVASIRNNIAAIKASYLALRIRAMKLQHLCQGFSVASGPAVFRVVIGDEFVMQ